MVISFTVSIQQRYRKVLSKLYYGGIFMTYHISKRGLVRFVSFSLAIVLVAAGFIYYYSQEATQSRRALEYHYLKSIQDLTQYTQNINSDLTKAMYANSPEMLAQLSSKIWREAGFAKDTLDMLPVEYLELQNTNKLLSQVGDYCVSLSKSFAKGNPITKEQREILQQLNEYCDTMSREVITTADSIRTGAISLSKVTGNINREFDKQPAPAELVEGFNEFEEGFSAYPTLIYDGPFSDHIMQKEPERLKGEKDVSKEEARKLAIKAANMENVQLTDGEDENSKMPSYGFEGDGISVSVTKKGGLVCYMLKSRAVESAKLSTEQGMEKAEAYMKGLGVLNMQPTYYEISNQVLTINYAYSQDGVLIYPDLIKVGVALDNGEIMSFDARGYIVNHKTRTFDSPKYTKEVAQQNVSPDLVVESSQLCIIPSDGLSEILCYEFKCKSSDGKDILVYINANTKNEERILILLVDENGTLTI